MGSVSKKQVYVIVGAIAFAVGLYFVPTKTEKTSKEEVKEVVVKKESIRFEDHLEKAKKHLNAESLDEINKIEAALSDGNIAKNVLLDSLGRIWDTFKQPMISAHYFELIANAEPNEKNWLNAAYRYFDAFKMAQDSSLRVSLVEKATICYTWVIEINPKNLDAKTDLGVCYTESPQPMKGIMLLREVVKEKPDHENAQLNLGLLSIKSRQFDKAVERFEKVLQINPYNIDVYLYLGEAHLQKGDKTKAIVSFEKYKSVSKDAIAVKEVDLYIEKIKNN